jgi:hypothetical protein
MENPTLDIADAIWRNVQQHGHIGLELEFRLGHALPNDHFSPNVGRDQFVALKKHLDASTSFDRVLDIETVEKIGDVKHVTTLAMSDSGVHNPPPPSFCMTKHKVFQKDVKVSSSPYTVRCSLAVERVVPLQAVNSHRMRHKKRRRYVYQCWAFDLTEVVSNTDIDTEESYEVEIELLDTGMLFERTMDSLAEWGLALVGDVLGMLVKK